MWIAAVRILIAFIIVFFPLLGSSLLCFTTFRYKLRRIRNFFFALIVFALRVETFNEQKRTKRTKRDRFEWHFRLLGEFSFIRRESSVGHSVGRVFVRYLFYRARSLL